MHDLLRDNLEGRLSGSLDPATDRELDRHLAQCAGCREQWRALAEAAEALRSLRPPQGMDFDLPPGFYARLVEQIESEREIPFWAMLVDPGFGRRVVFACLMLFALLGAYVAAFERPDYASRHRAEATLAMCKGPGCVTPLPAPRLGHSLEQNRGIVLASLAANGD